MDKNTEQKLKRIWCERLVIGMVASTALGFFITGVPVLYSQLQAQYDQAQAQYDQAQAQYDQAQAEYDQARAQPYANAEYDEYQTRALAPSLPLTLDRAQVQFFQVHTLHRWTQAQYYQMLHNRTQAQYYQTLHNQAQVQAQAHALQYQSMLLGISALCFILMLFWVGRQRNQISLPLTGQLIIVLPEEWIADLETSRHTWRKERRPKLWIRLMTGISVVNLLKTQIHIKVENLWLPKINGHNKIDD